MRQISILLVEDNEDDRFLTIRIIKKLPFEVKLEIAKNGAEGLRRIFGNGIEKQDLPSLILLDLQLPKIDGIKLLERVRDRYNEGELPVIILSSSDNPGDIALCRELGITGYLEKPLELSHLQPLLKKLAENQQPSPLSVSQ